MGPCSGSVTDFFFAKADPPSGTSSPQPPEREVDRGQQRYSADRSGGSGGGDGGRQSGR